MGGAGFETNYFVRHDPCPSCGSRNNLGRYSDGHGHCYGCGYREAGNGRVLEKTSNGAPIRQAKLEIMEHTKQYPKEEYQSIPVGNSV